MAGRRPKVRNKVTIPKKGKIRIDMSVKGIGRIRISSGTRDPDTYTKICEVLDDLENVGNLPTLQALKDGQVTALEVYSNAMNNGVKNQMTVNLDRPLIPTIEAWLKDHDVKERTRKSYRAHLNVFKSYTKSSDTIRQLVQRLDDYRKSATKKGTATTFSRTKSLLLAFAKHEYGATTELYLKIQQVPNIKNTKKAQVPHALSVPDVVRLTDAIKSAKAQEMVWSMCYTGFRIGEYLEQNEVEWATTPDTLNIIKHNPGHGNKGYSRVVFLAFPLSKPDLAERQFRRYIDAATESTGLKATSHTFRKCFAHWMEMAGIQRTRRQAYLGHANQSVTDLYEKHDVSRYLKEDARKFRDYVEAERNPDGAKRSRKKGRYSKMSQRLGVDIIDIDDIDDE